MSSSDAFSSAVTRNLMIYVDMDDKGNGTLERKPKKSYYWMKDVIASNGEKLWAE